MPVIIPDGVTSKAGLNTTATASAEAPKTTCNGCAMSTRENCSRYYVSTTPDACFHDGVFHPYLKGKVQFLNKFES
jgi:hypothetical protein